MRKIESIMTNMKYAFPPEHSVSEAIKLVISEESYGCAVIIEGGHPIGIVTERDYLKKVIALDLDPAQVKFSDIMKTEIITASPDMGIIEAGKVMKDKGIKHLPVLKNGKLVGVVTSYEIAHELVEEISELSNFLRETVVDLGKYREISNDYVKFEGYDSENLGKHLQIDDNCNILNPISDIMSKTVHTIKKDMNAADIAKKIADEKVDAMIVTENDIPLGIVSERTLLRKVLIEKKHPRDLLAKNIMVSPILTCKPETRVVTASKLMRKMGHNRIVVLDKGKMIGIVTDAHILEVMFELSKDLHWRIIGRWHDSDFRQ